MSATVTSIGEARAARVSQRLGELLAAIDDAETAVESIDPSDEAARVIAAVFGLSSIVLAKQAYDAERLASEMIPVLGTVQ